MKLHPIESDPKWRTMAKEAVRHATEQLNATPRHLLDPANPNHPDNFEGRLFGYPAKDFMAKQYRTPQIGGAL